jgi:uncharacterized protein YutE (UPF0331/DUF86 family)
MVDRTLILRKFSELDEYLGQLQEYQNLTARKYHGDWKTQRIVDRTLQMAIETCLDIASHLVSDRGWRTPDGYADTFRVLAENKVIGRGLLPKLERMAGFRNVIVHHYDRVDAAIVVDLLQKHLTDFVAFQKAIIKGL